MTARRGATQTASHTASEAPTRREHMLRRQILVILLAVGAYLAVRGVTVGDPSAAHGHAESVLSVERTLNLHWENRAQDLILGSSFLVSFFNFVYVWCFWPGVVGALVFAYRNDRARYLVLRNAMFISGSVGLIVFALFPVSPPRFLDGFTDTVATLSGSGSVAHPSSLTNEYAAMPSFHVGWTVLAGVVVFGALNRRVLRWLALVPGAVMSMTVVVTANHYVLDALAGIVVSLGGLYLARRAHEIRARRRAVVVALPPGSTTEVDPARRPTPAFDRPSVAA